MLLHIFFNGLGGRKTKNLYIIALDTLSLSPQAPFFKPKGLYTSMYII